jgi:hypothetical protein
MELRCVSSVATWTVSERLTKQTSHHQVFIHSPSAAHLLALRRRRDQEIHRSASCEQGVMASQTVPNGTEGYWPEPSDVACSDPSRSLAAGAPIVSPPSGWPACFKENAVMKAFVRAPIGVPRTTRRRRARAQTPFLPGTDSPAALRRAHSRRRLPPRRRAAVPPCRRGVRWRGPSGSPPRH